MKGNMTLKGKKWTHIKKIYKINSKLKVKLNINSTTIPKCV